MNRLPPPEEVKIEFYDKRIQEAVFDRIDLVIDFLPGKDGIGAVVKSFLDAIIIHDTIVCSIEAKLSEIDGLRRVYQKKSRLFRNLDSAWNIMLDNPVDFYEYVDLIPKMKNIEMRLQQITDSTIKANVMSEYQRFQALDPVCSKQLIIHQTYARARQERDDAMKALSTAEAELTQIKDSERQASLRISDDHIHAVETAQSLSAIFPNVHVGFVLSCINGDSVEGLPFDEVLRKVSRSKSPQTAQFVRYDFRYNSVTSEWLSLAELRLLGVCLEDPMLQRANFVNLAAAGDVDGVSELLMQGVDPSCCDYSGSSGLHLAAANRHSAVVEMLVRAGCTVNCRDKNLMTPLLFAASCGHMEMVRLLLDLGADKNCCDKNARSIVYYSVLSGNEAVVRIFLRPDRVNEADKLWGFTPLHQAASQGDIAMVRFLLQLGSSIYHVDMKGRTAEQISADGGHAAVTELLGRERLDAPAQEIEVREYRSQDRAVTISFWIGDEAAMEVRWCSDVAFTDVIYLSESADLPREYAWLSASKQVRLLHFRLPAGHSDDWAPLNSILADVIKRSLDALKADADCKVLICDASGESLSPAVLAVLLLLKSQRRVRDTLERCGELRPNVSVSAAARRGLDQLQKATDDKVLQRLDRHLRHSNVMSSAF